MGANFFDEYCASTARGFSVWAKAAIGFNTSNNDCLVDAPVLTPAVY
jgi:hypothetical protein